MLKRPPLVKPQKTPMEIIGNNRDMFCTIINGYQKSKSAGWDAYVSRIDISLRDKFGEILKECMSNGFYNPSIHNGKIFFQQLESGEHKETVPTTLCHLCEKDICSYKDGNGLFHTDEKRNDVLKCWEQKNNLG